MRRHSSSTSQNLAPRLFVGSPLSSLLCSIFVALTALAPSSAQALVIYRSGRKQDVAPKTTPRVCLAGGGDEDLWAPGWKSLLEAAAGGDVVFMRVNGHHRDYESWVLGDTGEHGFPKMNSVSTVVLESAKDADRREVLTAIERAELIYFTGGDQDRYINWLHGSKAGRALESALKVRKIPFGGMSAGMALLAGIDFKSAFPPPDASSRFVTSRHVLEDPTADFIDLDRSVLAAPFMSDVITETHSDTRDRYGRLMGFMARATYEFPELRPSSIKGIAADVGTALCYGESGIAQIYGAGRIHFVKGNAPVERITPGASLNWYADGKAVVAYAIEGKAREATFDLVQWIGKGGTNQHWSVDGTQADQAPIFHRSDVAPDRTPDGTQSNTYQSRQKTASASEGESLITLRH